MPQFKNLDSSIGRPKHLLCGQLIAIKVTNGGSGYTNGSSVAVTIGTPAAGGEAAVATAVVAGGIVQSITLSNPGSNFTSDPSVTMAGGTGLAVSIVRAPVETPVSQIVFVDATEAAVTTNKARGITGPGWWKYVTYTDQDGNVRYKTQRLTVVGAAGSVAGTTGDAENLVAANVATTITISVQPSNQTTVTGGATFSVTASVAPAGSPTYQWQIKAAGTTSKWTNVNGATSASLALTGRTSGNTGDQYRVVVSSTVGAVSVTSNAATLTFGT